MKKETQDKEVRKKETSTKKTSKKKIAKEKASKKRVQKKKILRERYEEYRKILEGFTLMNDAFMRNVLKDKACTEYVLQVILQDVGLKVLEQVLQKDFKNLQGRSATMDCVARSTDGRMFDVEIQREIEGASPKRARYYSGLLDANTLDPGENFDELPESFVIFITRDDVLGGSLPIYHIKKQIIETGKDFGDESYIIYVNTDCQDDTDLGRLMHDFHCKNAGEMYSEVLAKRVRELKETEKGVKRMCKEMERIYQEGRMDGERSGVRRGVKRGERKKAQEMAIYLSKHGVAVSKIAAAANVSVRLVKKWLSGSMGMA